MMMALGQFVFSLSELAYQELQRRTSWKHRSTPRVGGRDARQYTGPGDDTIALSGWFAPDDGIGKLSSLADLRKMADEGDGYAMVDGTGTVYGAFVIESMTEGQSLHKKDGTPRRIEFTIDLTRVDDGLVTNKTTPAKDSSK
jgi:uncharacterized protein